MDPQDSSPLFRLPVEVREVIWRHATAAYDDVIRPHDYATHYWRPQHEFAKRVDTELLMTCRAIYAEASHMPLALNTAYFWCYRGPRGQPASNQRARTSMRDHWETSRANCRRTAVFDPLHADADVDEDDTPWHFERYRRNSSIPMHLIRSAHLFTQQYFLECDNFMFVTMAKEMAHVETLTLTLRGSDWWNFAQGQPLGIDPRLAAAVTHGRMLRTWDADARGVHTTHHQEAWGYHIRNLPKLQTLIVEMEVDDSREEAVKQLAEHALAYWTFPRHEGGYLSGAGPIKVVRWEGPACLGMPTVPPQKSVGIATYTLRFVDRSEA